MKSIIIGIILVINPLFAAFGQDSGEGIDPPGTLQLTENLYVDSTPVTNLMFLEYLTMKDYLKSKGYDSWKNYYTEKNETNWRKGLKTIYPSLLKELEHEESLLSRRGYFWDLHYQKSPVLRVTKAQAQDFCQWRTEMVEYAWSYFPNYKGQKKFADKILYRLPTREELESANKYFFQKGQLVSIRKKNPLRYLASSKSEGFTLYNISEFTSTDDLYGENWKNVIPGIFPNDFTGFRCVCEVKE